MRGRGESNKLIYLALTGAILVVASLYILSPAKVSASDDHLVINEIYPNQIADGVDTEWAEIYDPDNLDLDLTKYSLVKITGTGMEYKKQLSDALCPRSGQYYTCNLETGWLANSGATIVLRNNAVEIDRVVFGGLSNNALVPNQGQSISRIPNSQDTDNDANDFQIVPVTKGGENILPPPIVYSDNITISEIAPEPATLSDDEYIELYNKGPEAVDLSGWRLDDITPGAEFIIPIGTKINGYRYLVFCKNSIADFCYANYHSISLNDESSDLVVLIDPNGDTKSSTRAYEKSNRGQSYSLFENDWKWTEELTPGSENVLRISSPTVEEDGVIFTADIKAARAKEDGETVSVEGTVSVLPGVLSNQYFYIQDDLSGIQIYNYDKNFPELKGGDLVSVLGELATTSNERRIKILDTSDIIVIRQNSPPSPIFLDIDQIGEEFEGRYVEIVGTISKTTGNTFYVHGSEEIQVNIRTLTGIIKPKMKRGDSFYISGILSQYQNYYRILPISKDGVRILTSGQLPESGCDKPSDSINLDKLWKSQPSQPMRRKRLVTNLEKL